MTSTHLLLPVAVAVAFAKRPIPWRLLIVASVASAAPDIDGLFKHFLHVAPNSIYGHRGATHSLFVALLAGLAAAAFHKSLGVRALTAGVLITAAMASHGILDMMTDAGKPVAYLWPLTSVRLFAEWRPIHSSPIEVAHFMRHALPRLMSDFRQIIIPLFIAAFAIRLMRTMKDMRWQKGAR